MGNVGAPPVPGAELLLLALGVPAPFVLAISDMEQPDEVLRKLEGSNSTDHAIVACAGGLWSKTPTTEVRLLAKGTTGGVVLAALAQMSRRTINATQRNGISRVETPKACVSEVRCRQQQSGDVTMQLRARSLSRSLSSDVVGSLEEAVAELAAGKVAGGLAHVVH